MACFSASRATCCDPAVPFKRFPYTMKTIPRFPFALSVLLALLFAGCAGSETTRVNEDVRHYVAPLNYVVERAQEVYPRVGLFLEGGSLMEDGSFVLTGAVKERVGGAYEPIRIATVNVVVTPVTATEVQVRVLTSDVARRTVQASRADNRTSNYARTFLTELDKQM